MFMAMYHIWCIDKPNPFGSKNFERGSNILMFQGRHNVATHQSAVNFKRGQCPRALKES
jgi:hypothetical protein